MKKTFLFTTIMLFTGFLSLFAQSHGADTAYPTKVLGRWDLVIQKDGKELPSWLEVRHSGRETLVGRFVYEFGSARPVAHVKYANGKFNFSIPPQYEPGLRYQDF